MQPRVPKTLVLQEAYLIAPGVRHLAFYCKDSASLPFIPGQFITIHFTMDGEKLQRSYSIASIPGKSELIEFAAAYVEGGRATRLLFGLQPGDEITVTGPFGRLILRDELPKRYLLVATGTGVTPYRSMLPQLSERLRQHPELEIKLLLGVPKPEDLLYGSDFLAFAKQHPNFHFHACYSRAQLSNPAPHEFQGYVQHYFPKLHLNPETDLVYLCGNPNMIDEAFTLLLAQGFQSSQVRREKYVSSR